MKEYFEKAQNRTHYDFKLPDDDSVYMDKYNEIVKIENAKVAKRDNMTVDEYEEVEQQQKLDNKTANATKTPEEKEGTSYQAPAKEEKPAAEAKKGDKAEAEKKEDKAAEEEKKEDKAEAEKKEDKPEAEKKDKKEEKAEKKEEKAEKVEDAEPAVAVADEKANKSEKK